MPRPLHVFLCHASQDKPAVRELYKLLKTEDWIDPWLDEEKITLGQHWTTVIEDALHNADVVLIFLSSSSVQKEGFIQRELNYAWEISLEKPREVIFLIPFRLDNCEIPRYLSSRQWGDYFGDKKEKTYQTLLRSLRHRHTQKLRVESVEKDIEEKIKSENVQEDKLEKSNKEWKPLQKIESEKVKLENNNESTYNEPRREIHKQKDSKQPIKKNRALFFAGWLSIAGIVIVAFLCILFGGNYLYKNFRPLITETPTFSPIETPTFSPTESFTNTPQVSEFPITLDAQNLILSDTSVNYITRLSIEEVMAFYRNEFNKRGLTEDEINTVIFNGVLSMIFDGHPSGKEVIIQGVDLGDGTVSVTITLQDV